MVRMVRAVLIWCLALALPAQGVLAATMAFCGPNHPVGASAVTATQDDGHAARHAQESAAHSGMGAAHDHAEDAISHESAAADTFAQSDLQKCSVCASCCSATAIHDTAPKLPVPEAASARFAAPVSIVEPFAADGPDRPPRHILA
jgi:hypothetical protein